MLIREKLGNLATFQDKGRMIDRLPLEWYECNKRLLRKCTGSGREVALKFMGEAHYLEQDDILYADDRNLIVVEVLTCDAIVLKPMTLYEMAFACYEIGNKHLPLFYENNTLLMPYEAPLFRMLQVSGFAPQREKRKLLHPLRTTVAPHSHPGDRKESLFSKILKLTASPNE